MGGFFETHFHTMEVSSCGRVPAAEGVRRYHAAGYDGIVVTDHYTEGFFGDMPADTSWRDKLDRYLTGWRAARDPRAWQLSPYRFRHNFSEELPYNR